MCRYSAVRGLSRQNHESRIANTGSADLKECADEQQMWYEIAQVMFYYGLTICLGPDLAVLTTPVAYPPTPTTQDRKLDPANTSHVDQLTRRCTLGLQ